MQTTIMQKEIFEQTRVLVDCLGYNEKTLKAIADEVNKRGISLAVIAARGSSDNAGNYFKYIFECLTGIPVMLAAPSINTLYGGNLAFGTKTLVIGVSQSGAAEDVMAVLANAKKCGAITVSITNNLQSKMLQMTDFHLYCNAGEEKSVAATKTFLSQMYLLGLLAAKTAKNIQLTDKFSRLWQGVEKVLKLEKEIEEVAAQYVNVQSAYVLARGMNYSIAFEASLKLQETCYLNARPYAASDFAHGPFALIDESSHVILFAPSGNSQADMQNMKGKLIECGANILMFTDKAELAKGANLKIILPPCEDDFISPFYNAVAIQLFACKLSTARGLNPDAPRGLKKVTVTV